MSSRCESSHAPITITARSIGASVSIRRSTAGASVSSSAGYCDVTPLTGRPPLRCPPRARSSRLGARRRRLYGPPTLAASPLRCPRWGRNSRLEAARQRSLPRDRIEEIGKLERGLHRLGALRTHSCLRLGVRVAGEDAVADRHAEFEG